MAKKTNGEVAEIKGRVSYSVEHLETCLYETLHAAGGTMYEAIVTARFETDYIGGMPSDEKSIRAFCEHHLGLAGDALESAVSRMLKEEVSEDTTLGEDELKEIKSYGLTVIRRDDEGRAWVGSWQIRAMIAQAASRLHLFVKKTGSKGDLKEGLYVEAHGPSAIGHWKKIGILLDGKTYTGRETEKFMGSVSGPSGRRSIVGDKERAPEGCEIHFRLRWPTFKIEPDDMAAILAFGQNLGLGSVRSKDHGKFKITQCEIGPVQLS